MSEDSRVLTSTGDSIIGKPSNISSYQPDPFRCIVDVDVQEMSLVLRAAITTMIFENLGNADTPSPSRKAYYYYDNGPGIIASTSVLAFLATIAVALRFWARRLVRVPLALDDYLVIAGLLTRHIELVADLIIVIGGGLGRDYRLVAKNPNTVVVLYKSIFAGEVVYGFSSSIVKLAVLALIWRIFPTRTIKIVGIALASIIISWTIAIEIVNFLQCQPLKAFWQIELQSLPETRCVDLILYLLSNSIANTIIDFIALVLPIREILKLQMSRSKKFAVCGIFLLGGIAFAASLARTISTAIIHNQGITNFTKQFVVSGVATFVEIYVGIIGACIPVLAPVYQRLRFGKVPNTSAKRTPVIGSSSNNYGNDMLRIDQGSYNQLHDDDLVTVINDTSADYHESGRIADMDIVLHEIRGEQSTEWLKSKQSA
ncbi:hypothetical protein GQX73_g1928 [Xylaria multiplex]|uniref:Rhodopsin domain-containing protein n=1 Tax=Xylaria multiplex TaxID=323545 RepID=A0A7C8N2J3_9PEZI|nr:hypothetical protein GQX73_g1928 [Xylaria multiplex]